LWTRQWRTVHPTPKPFPYYDASRGHSLSALRNTVQIETVWALNVRFGCQVMMNNNKWRLHATENSYCAFLCYYLVLSGVSVGYRYLGGTLCSHLQGIKGSAGFRLQGIPKLSGPHTGMHCVIT
jgi:hypothetical protein